MKKKTCSCDEHTSKTVFACSGAADLGQISDLVARKMHQNGDRQMKCLAFVGAGIENMINSIKDSDMLIIDGCPLDCGKLTMEKNNLDKYTHVRLTDFGYVKGETPANPHHVEEVYCRMMNN
jgi:uncharacterized metal-binding protein